MLAYTVHDVRVVAEVRELPPQDGWACWESTGLCHLKCSCGYSDGPMPKTLGNLVAHQHVLSGA